MIQPRIQLLKFRFFFNETKTLLIFFYLNIYKQVRVEDKKNDKPQVWGYNLVPDRNEIPFKDAQKTVQSKSRSSESEDSHAECRKKKREPDTKRSA